MAETETSREPSSALDDPEFQKTQGTYYGQHTKLVYVVGSIVFLAVGALVGYFVLPDDWLLWRKLAGGGFLGLWCGYCVFAWRFLFYGTVD